MVRHVVTPVWSGYARFIFALMDSDGDGIDLVSRISSRSERIFKAMDFDKDGTLALEEI